MDYKEKILVEATKLFLKYGISETGVAEIARAVGISKGTLYYHYKSKNALIDSVADEYFSTMDLMFSTFLTEKRIIKNIDSIAKWLVHIIKHNVEVEYMHYLLLSYGMINYPELKAKFKDKYTEWTGMIISCLDTFQKNPDNHFYATMLLSIIEGEAIRNVIGMPNASIDSKKLSKLIKNIKTSKN